MARIREPTNGIRHALRTLDEIDRNASPERVVLGLSESAEEAKRQIAGLKADLAKANAKVAGLESVKQDLEHALNDKPPIIKIAEAGKDGKKEYRFESGKANVSSEFKEALRNGGFKELAAEILSRNREIRTVDTLEIIGHTDGVAVATHGNLDNLLPAFLADSPSVFLRLTPGSNNDLGLLRALAIKSEWLEFVAEHANRVQLGQIEVRCYSAGQTIPEGIEPSDVRIRSVDLFKKENEKFRRIEIRLTKLL